MKIFIDTTTGKSYIRSKDSQGKTVYVELSMPDPKNQIHEPNAFSVYVDDKTGKRYRWHVPSHTFREE